MNNHRLDVSSRPLLVGGMHRSGTSLTASLFAGAGLDLGPEMLGASPSNPAGHFEDLGFLAFHRRALEALGLCTDGYTDSARGTVPAHLEPEARDLLAARTRPGVAWGWKEPRTTLFLDFWQDRIPDARHVFVFRRPWEVADSLFRRGDDIFALNPAFALDVWTHYNRRIIDFVARHAERCLVFEVSQVIADPAAVIAAVRSRLDVPLAAPGRRYVDELFTRDDAGTRATLVRELAPEAWRTYLELRGLAGCEAEEPTRDGTLRECAIREWARASSVASRARAVEARIRAELGDRAHAPVDERVRAQNEERRDTAAPERRPRHSPATVVGRVSATLLAAARWARSHPRPAPPVEAPELLPFPRSERAGGEQRAA